MLKENGGSTFTGPLFVGLNKPVQIVSFNNMAAIATYSAESADAEQLLA